MTPAEKAKELVDKYIDQMIESDAYFVKSGAKHCALIAVDESVNTFISIHHKLTGAKHCALIAVEELIKEESNYNNGSFYQSNYWNEVKTEIEKL